MDSPYTHTVFIHMTTLAEPPDSKKPELLPDRALRQLRQAQAVVLPLDYEMSLADTALVIGVSPGWACQLRKRFMRGQVVGASART